MRKQFPARAITFDCLPRRPKATEGALLGDDEQNKAMEVSLNTGMGEAYMLTPRHMNTGENYEKYS
jgi:hypothetical protein